MTKEEIAKLVEGIEEDLMPDPPPPRPKVVPISTPVSIETQQENVLLRTERVIEDTKRVCEEAQREMAENRRRWGRNIPPSAAEQMQMQAQAAQDWGMELKRLHEAAARDLGNYNPFSHEAM